MSEAVARQYESVVIFDPRLNDAQIKDEVKRFEGVLTTNKAVKITTDLWGRKETAYPIKKLSTGVFVCFKYESLNHEVANALGALLKLADSVHKFQTHLIGQPSKKFKVNPKRQARRNEFDEDESGFGDD
jgi:small subunit ribosomal protein S6